MLSLLVGIRVPHNPIINDERDRKKGSLQKYSGDLKFGSPAIWNPDKWLPFCQKLFETWTKTSGIWMVGTIVTAIAKARPFENQTI